MSKRKTPWHRHTPPKHLAAAPKTAAPHRRQGAAPPPAEGRKPLREWALLFVFWSYVLIPLSWGVASTVRKALLLFK
jgi:hypothetical protein